MPRGFPTLRLQTRAYRAHDPRWSFLPTSGRGVAITGGRFNMRGTEALYLSLDPVTALAECTQGFAARMQPLTLCEYDVDVERVADLTVYFKSPSPLGEGLGWGGEESHDGETPPPAQWSLSDQSGGLVPPLLKGRGDEALLMREAMSYPWLRLQREGRIAPSQALARDLARKGHNGALVPSFVPGIRPGATNLVLWKWSDTLPCRVMAYDPDGRLVK